MWLKTIPQLTSICLALLLLPLLVIGQEAQEKAPEGERIAWQEGPTTADIGTEAKIAVPEGYLFAGPEGAKRFLEITENIPSGGELGILTPAEGDWFVLFEFDDVGYVKDDEKDSLDADALLKTIQESTEAANEERRRRGWGTLEVLGWLQPPHYEESTHNLEWATKAKDSEGGMSTNHKTRYLGRRGVMRVNLVAGVDELPSVLPEYRKAMLGFAYTPDSDYRAFVSGDKVAEYGLTALVVGGAAAAAAKTGFLKSFWKLIVAAVVGLGALLKKLFNRQPKEDDTQPYSS